MTTYTDEQLRKVAEALGWRETDYRYWKRPGEEELNTAYGWSFVASWLRSPDRRLAKCQ